MRTLKKITLQEFDLLELNERMEAINQLGTLLDNHVTRIERCNLYEIDMFFVEVVYNPKHKTIPEVRSFKTSYLLDKYSSL